jgi:hypothetical protein
MANPFDFVIWVRAAILEEKNGNDSKVTEIIKRAYKKLGRS